jgi:phosphoribosylaminoimidazolecarboxamide formyltransferase / IMP cyclohydrolase
VSGATIDSSLYRERDVVPIRRAIVAVSDKTGLVDLARALAEAGVEIVSTGGTSKAIADAGIPVTQIGDLTGFPEHLDGRVRTLHPKVHSGLLADLRLESHEEELAQFDIAPFELAVVNLYPFAATVASGAEPDQIVEQIDIGGPAMVRASPSS